MEPLEHSATNSKSSNNKNDETSGYDSEAEEESEAERGLLGSLERRRVSVTTAAGDVWPAAAGPTIPGCIVGSIASSLAIIGDGGSCIEQ